MGMGIDGLGHNALPRYCYAPHQSMAHILRAGTCDVTLQAGWTVFNMDAIERMNCRVLRHFARPALRKRRDDQDRVRERKRKLSAPIENIVIAGAGQAGGRAAEALRARGFQGAITMLGEEPHPPYERPQFPRQCCTRPMRRWPISNRPRTGATCSNVRLETGAAVTDCDADAPHGVDGRWPLVRFRSPADRDRNAASPARRAGKFEH